MSYYGAGLHKFITGDIRTDGWRSDWRISLERRMAEEALKPRPIVKTSKAPEPKIVRTRKSRPSRAKAPKIPGFTRMGMPSGLNNVEYQMLRRTQWRAQGLCGSCGEPTSLGRASCAACLDRKASYYCKKVGKPYIAKKIEPKFCKVCQVLLKANNIYGHCRTHYKQKRRELTRKAQ